ncbi:MAG TPA: dihydrofolate reductase family protein [Verrucomicrobiae bacterium]
MIRTRSHSSISRPWIFVNMAMTADGKIASANRVVHTFGSARDLAQLYTLRSTADAILCGARTVEISEATLGNGPEKFTRRRQRAGRAKFPLRIVVSGSASLSPTAKIFQTGEAPLIILVSGRAPGARIRKLQALADHVKIFGGAEVDFAAAFAWLHSEFGIRRLLCEGGAEVNDALFRADLVDEINLTHCPLILGGRSAPTIAEGQGLAKLALTKDFQLQSRKFFKGELFTSFIRTSPVKKI